MQTARTRAILAVFALAAGIAAGCAGTEAPRVSSVSTVPTAGSGASAARAKATLVLRTAARASAAGRRTNYVSPNSQSLVVSAGGLPLGTLSLAGPACTATGGGSEICSVTFSAPVGTAAYTFATYASTDGSGTPLSLVSAPETVVANADNTIHATLDGVVASLAVALNPPTVLLTSPPSTTNVTVTVLARDASQALIVGPGVYVDASGNPLTIALSDSDTSGNTTLGQTSLASPGPVTLAFRGTTAIGTVTLTAAAPSVSPASAMLAVEGQPLVAPLTVSGPEEPVILNSGATLGLANVPDGFFPVIFAGGQYTAWTAGIIGCQAGSMGVMTSSDLLNFTPTPLAVPSPDSDVPCSQPTTAQAAPVFGPSAYDVFSPYFDAEYAAPGTVLFTGGRYLLIYHGENHSFYGPDGMKNSNEYQFYATIGEATSPDGLAWTRAGAVGTNAIIAAVQPMPSTAPSGGLGAAEPVAAIRPDGFIYVLYSELALPGGPAGFALARAPVASPGPGAWSKWYQGAFSQPAVLPTGGIGGAFSPLLPDGGPCTGPQRQAGLAFYAAAGVYVLTMTCNTGFFYAESPDLVSWSIPAPIPGAPVPTSAPCAPTYSHVVLLSTNPPAMQGAITSSGWLYYAKETNAGSPPPCPAPTPSIPPGPHQMYRMPFTLGG